MIVENHALKFLLLRRVKLNTKQYILLKSYKIKVILLPASVSSSMKFSPSVLSHSKLVFSAFGAANFSWQISSSPLLLLNLFGSNMSVIENEILWLDVIFHCSGPRILQTTRLYGEKEPRDLVRNYARSSSLHPEAPSSASHLCFSHLGLRHEWNVQSDIFKASAPPFLEKTRDTNTISVSHERLMVSKRSPIIAHIIKCNNWRPESKLGTDGTWFIGERPVSANKDINVTKDIF